MRNVTGKVQVIQGALIAALFLGFVGFNVGFVIGGPGDTSSTRGNAPPPADWQRQDQVEYSWDLPTAALAGVGYALVGSLIGALAVLVVRLLFGIHGGTVAVTILGALGGALLGNSVGGYVAGERLVVFTANSAAGTTSVTTTVHPNGSAALVAALLGTTIGGLAGRGMSQMFCRPKWTIAACADTATSSLIAPNRELEQTGHAK
jgi:hypothetical protein